MGILLTFIYDKEQFLNQENTFVTVIPVTI